MIELRSISKKFGAFTALDGVSLVVRRGEFLTLLGPSGCGKTTCVRLVAGLDQPTSGSVWLDGRDVTHEPPYARDANTVFQSYALFPHMNVAENIAFGLRMKKLGNADITRRVAQTMEIVSLQGLDHRRPAELSGGQRQRVALARAIACEPKVLLLDEPLSALDARLRQKMQGELKQLQRRLGITFILVTHDQSEALAMSDRIAVMNHGRIEQTGTPSEIYHQPQTGFVATFVGDTNLFDVQVIETGSGGSTVKVRDGFLLRISGTIPETGNAKVLVRPEKIHLERERHVGENSFHATVEDRIFKGHVTELYLRSTCGLRILAMVRNDGDPASEFQTGTTVSCRIDPADAMIVREH